MKFGQPRDRRNTFHFRKAITFLSITKLKLPYTGKHKNLSALTIASPKTTIPTNLEMTSVLVIYFRFTISESTFWVQQIFIQSVYYLQIIRFVFLALSFIHRKFSTTIVSAVMHFLPCNAMRSPLHAD